MYWLQKPAKIQFKCFPAYKSLQFREESASLFLAHINCTEIVIRSKKSLGVFHSYIQTFQDNRPVQNKKFDQSKTPGTGKKAKPHKA